MAKNLNKRFLMIFAAILSAVCLSVSFGLSGGYAKAEEEHTVEEAKQYAAEIKNEISDLYGQFYSLSGLHLDENKRLLEERYEYVVSRIEEGYDVYSDCLEGDFELGGIKGIAQLAIDFYDYYVSESGEFAAEYPSLYKKYLGDAKNYLKGFAISEYKAENFDKKSAQTYYDEYAQKIEVDGEKYKAESDEVQAVYDSYMNHEDSGYVRYVRGKLPSIDRDLAKAKEDLTLCTEDEKAKKIVSDFKAEFYDVYSYMQYLAYEKVDPLWERFKDAYNSSTTSDSVKKTRAESVLAECENALTYYSGMTEKTADDTGAASNVLTTYKNACNNALRVVKSMKSSDYGATASETINNNLKLAESLIKVLDTRGLLPDDYKYGAVRTGSDVVKAFEESYTVRRAVRNMSTGESSTVPDKKLSRLTKSYDGMYVTITSVDANGEEVCDFDRDATLDVFEGTSPTILRNINVLLGRDNLIDSISRTVRNREKISEQLKNKHLHYYFTLTVKEGGVVRENFDGRYKIEIRFADGSDVLNYKNGINVINYYHTQITGAVAEDEINMEGNQIMFYTDNPTQFAVVSGTSWTDYALIAVIGVVAVIAIILLTTLIVYLVKNRKFKVRFDANGGEPTKIVRVKHKEKFAYPKNPTRNGYVFMGWFTTPDFETRFASTELLTRKKVRVYAKWITEEEYKALIAETEEEIVPTVMIADVEEPAGDKAEPVAEETLAETNENEETSDGAGETVATEAAEAVETEEEQEFDVVDAFDNLKSEMFSYKQASDLPYGLETEHPVCFMKVDQDRIVLELDLSVDELKAKGYDNVSEGETLQAKVEIAVEDDCAVAKELIEEVMLENGMRKTDQAVLTAATEGTREEGFKHGVTAERLAETAEELFKVLRAYAKSFVLADKVEGEDKPLLKMFTLHGKVYLYLNYFADGMMECDGELKEKGFRSFVVVRNVEECKEAENVIRAMMKENGLVRYPTEVTIAEDGSDKGFTYTLKH